MPPVPLLPYQVDYLYLLIGENPLPNYVAALTLLRPGGTLFLVHTGHTQKQVKALTRVLQDGIPPRPVIKVLPLGSGSTASVPEEQANGFQIYQTIQKSAQELPGSVGMNYTGGTKTMAVHAYRALEHLRPDAVFSYLDPHLLKMMIDHPQAPPLQIPVELPLTLEQILALHSLTWQPEAPPCRDPVHPELATQLAILLVNPSLKKRWLSWRRDKVDPLKAHFDSQYPPQLISVAALPEPLQACLAQHLILKNNHLDVPASCSPHFDHPYQLIGWLHGLWLEDFVLATIQTLAPQYGIHDYGLSLQIQNPQQRQDPFPQFELDVAFTKGYQLFAISCTTAQDKATCKQKLFEATQRARQLGGAEARIGLVCASRRPHLLQSELELVTRNRKLKVFGIPQWGSLDRHIAEWIRENT